eukprot:7398294-Pyramimonas_sp.AAC.1
MPPATRKACKQPQPLQTNLQDGSRLPSRRPRWPKMACKMPPRRPRRPQESPTGPQDAPKTAQDGINTAQDVPKGPQEWCLGT